MPRFQDIPLLQKIAFLPLTAILALAGVAALGVVGGDRLEARLTALNDVVFEGVQRGLELKDTLGIFHAHLFALMAAAANESDAARRDKVAADLHSELERVAAAIGKVAADRSNDTLPKAFTAYKDAALMAIDIGSTDASYGAIMMGDADQQFWKLRTEAEALNRALGEERSRVVAALRDDGRRGERQTILVAILVSVASLAVAWIIARQITRPVTRLTRTMTVLAENDLDVPVPDRDRRDEVGLMAGALDTFKTSMLSARRLEEDRALETERQLERAGRVSALTGAFQTELEALLAELGAASDSLWETSEAMKVTAEITSGASAVAAGGAERTAAAVETVPPPPSSCRARSARSLIRCARPATPSPASPGRSPKPTGPSKACWGWSSRSARWPQ